MSYRLKFNAEKCVGCYACHMACLDAHHDVEDVQAKSHRTIKKVVKDQFEKNICPGCVHCGACMKVCPVQAIYKDTETGFVLVDQSKCIGCHACERVCPVKVIRFNEAGKMEKCDGCIERIREGREPACVRVCFPGAITLERTEDDTDK